MPPPGAEARRPRGTQSRPCRLTKPSACLKYAGLSLLRKTTADIRLFFAYTGIVMGEMRRAIQRENEEKQRDRFASTLVIAAAIIAAVRLARDDIGTPSPKVMCAVADSVQLAKMILKRVTGQ